jgi:hypothetical protein
MILWSIGCVLALVGNTAHGLPCVQGEIPHELMEQYELVKRLDKAANHLWEGSRDAYNLALKLYEKADALDKKVASMDPNDPDRASIVAQAQWERDMGDSSMDLSNRMRPQAITIRAEADEAIALFCLLLAEYQREMESS